MANAVPDDLEIGVRPLPAPTLDVAKLNDESRQRREAEMIRLLRLPLRAGDSGAIQARNEALLKLAHDSGSYWSGTYRDRFEAARESDELITLIRGRLSRAFAGQLRDILTMAGPPAKPKKR